MAAPQMTAVPQMTTAPQMAPQTIVVSNQGGQHIPQTWKFGICNIFAAGCCECLLGIFCCPCANYACAMKKMSPELKNLCCECIKAYCFPCCCAQCMRSEMRQYYNITGNCCGDCICICCCYPCVGIQMHAEAKIQNFSKSKNQNNCVTVAYPMQYPTQQPMSYPVQQPIVQQQIQQPIQQQQPQLQQTVQLKPQQPSTTKKTDEKHDPNETQGLLGGQSAGHGIISNESDAKSQSPPNVSNGQEEQTQA